MSILFAPHNDDETLFASFLCLRHKPLVVVCLQSQVQERRGDGILHLDREVETACAMQILGCRWTQWTFSDADPDWEKMREAMQQMAPLQDDARVFAPAWEHNGHPQHNAVANLAQDVFGERLVSYLTYTRGGKSEWGSEVEYELDWVPLKLRALCCYGSQISHPLQAEHFLRSYKEYVASDLPGA